MAPLLTIPIHSRRDVIWARQRARRLAALLQFDHQEQALVAAVALKIADHAREFFGVAELHFQVDNKTLHIFAQRPERDLERPKRQRAPQQTLRDPMRFARAIPVGLEASAVDLQWVLKQIPLIEPVNLFEEVKRQNDEVLELFYALRKPEPQLPSAETHAVA